MKKIIILMVICFIINNVNAQTYSWDYQFNWNNGTYLLPTYGGTAYYNALLILTSPNNVYTYQKFSCLTGDCQRFKVIINNTLPSNQFLTHAWNNTIYNDGYQIKCVNGGALNTNCLFSAYITPFYSRTIGSDYIIIENYVNFSNSSFNKFSNITFTTYYSISNHGALVSTAKYNMSYGYLLSNTINNEFWNYNLNESVTSTTSTTTSITTTSTTSTTTTIIGNCSNIVQDCRYNNFVSCEYAGCAWDVDLNTCDTIAQCSDFGIGSCDDKSFCAHILVDFCYSCLWTGGICDTDGECFYNNPSTTTTTISTTTTTIINNALYNYSVYFNKNNCDINNAYTEVYLYSCNNENYYINPNKETLYLNCNNKIPNYVNLNGSGYYNYYDINLDITKKYLGFLYQDTLTAQFNYPLIFNPIDFNNYNIIFNISYVCENIISSEICFKSVDSLSNGIKTSYGLNDGIINKVGDTSVLGLACFNVTDLTKSYYVNLNASGYNFNPTYYIFKLFDNKITPKIFMLNLNGNNPNITQYYYNVSGYVMNESHNTLSNIDIINTCTNDLTSTNSAGYYRLYNFDKSDSTCGIQTRTNGEYIDESKNAKINGMNGQDVNFTLILNNNENKRTIEILVETVDLSINIGNIQLKPVYNAKVIFKSSGHSDTIYYTDTSGYVTKYNAFDFTDYIIEISAKGFESKIVSISNTENYKQVILIPSIVIECIVSGNIYLVNNSINNPVFNNPVDLYKNGFKVLSTLSSSDTGYYEFKTECDNAYNVISSYFGQTLTYNVRPLDAEIPIIQDFKFLSVNSERQAKQETIIDLMWNYFVPIAIMVIILMGALVLTKLLDEFYR